MSFFRTSSVIIALAVSACPALAEGSKWGAIALDTEKAEREPYYGVGGADTEADAVAAAMGFCTEAGGVQCQSLVTYEQCGALAVTGKGQAGWGKAPSKEEAEKQAIAGCAEAECTVVVSDCN